MSQLLEKDMIMLVVSSLAFYSAIYTYMYVNMEIIKYYKTFRF